MPVYRLGLDPEVAIVSKKTGKGRSAHTFMGDGIKKFVFYSDSEEYEEGLTGSEVQRDGAAIEHRSVVDSACRDNIIPYFAEALRQTHLKVRDWRKSHFQLSTTPLFELDTKSLEAPPEDVLEFGCRPDYDAYKLDVKDPSIPEGDKRRYTGGHVHASSMGARGDIKEQAALAILYDYFVAMPMVAMLGDKFADGEAERRNFYGQPGSFRYDDKLDKIEFRTLSGRLQLHPTVMGWVLGMVKSIGGAYSTYQPALMELTKEISAQEIYEIIQNHDYRTAETLIPKVFKLMPNYDPTDKYALTNTLGGGGSGTLNPYFFERSMEVFVEARKEGLLWDDDLEFNWGLYDDYQPTHHKYWGVQTAFAGMCDDDIFPMNKLLPKMWDQDALHGTPIYTHPVNGGAGEWVTDDAPGWLQ